MAKKNLKNEIRHEADKKEEVEEKEIKKPEKPVKKKRTAHEKRKLVLKIIGILMAISMIFGTLMSIIGPLMYK